MEGHNQVVEIEYLNNYIYKSNRKIIIAILFFLIRKIQTKEFYLNSYELQVIEFGFMGTYPAIGIKYLRKEIDYYTTHKDLEKKINKEFNDVINEFSLKDFLNFSIKNEEMISNTFNSFRG